jgi:hypothetical protein
MHLESTLGFLRDRQKAQVRLLEKEAKAADEPLAARC